jgi:hypothetical protein
VFGGRVTLDRVVAAADVEFDDAAWTHRNGDTAPATAGEGWLTADFASVGGHLSLVDVQLAGDLRIRDATLERVRFDPERVAGERTCYVDLARSSVERGRLGQPTAGTVLYDLYRTTLGAVQFGGDRTVLDSVRFLRTRYDGFDFAGADDLHLAASGHRIHGLAEGPTTTPCYCGDGPEHGGRYVVEPACCPRHDRRADAAALEATYAYAKNGADAAGDNHGAGAFFYEEMRHRRRGQFGRALSRTPGPPGARGRVVAASRWGRSLTLAAVAGYGEYPYRVVVASLVVIGVFAGAYWTGSPFDTDLGAFEAFVFSLQSYVSFVLGPPGNTTLTGQLLTAIEGYVGAFLVALFVFTFTRRLNR